MINGLDSTGEDTPIAAFQSMLGDDIGRGRGRTVRDRFALEEFRRKSAPISRAFPFLNTKLLSKLIREDLPLSGGHRLRDEALRSQV